MLTLSRTNIHIPTILTVISLVCTAPLYYSPWIRPPFYRPGHYPGHVVCLVRHLVTLS